MLVLIKVTVLVIMVALMVTVVAMGVTGRSYAPSLIGSVRRIRTVFFVVLLVSLSGSVCGVGGDGGGGCSDGGDGQWSH